MKIIISLLCAWGLISCTAEKEDPAQTTPEPIAQVQTVKLQKADISKTLRVYGTVLPWPDKLQTVSVAYASRIESVAVTEGQLVQKDELLLTLKASDDTDLQWTQAQKEQAAALQAQQLLQERLDLQLATRQELNAAQLRAEQAKTLLDNLLDRGMPAQRKGVRQIKAEQAGIIHLVSVQARQIVPAHSPLLQWLDQNQSAVRLSIEPEDIDLLQRQQPVLITSVNKPTQQAVSGAVETISHQIDPATRLLNVWVRLKQNNGLLINDFVEAQIIVSSANALVAPRSALLPDGNGYRLFTIANGHAVQHQVQTGLANDAQIEIIADDVHEQDDIVVVGNYELEDGMAVRMQQP